MNIATYKVLLANDNGTTECVTIATSRENAIANALKATNAPDNAVISCRIYLRPIDF